MVLLLLSLVLLSVSRADDDGFQGSNLELQLADLEKSYIPSEVFNPPSPHNIKCPLSQLHHDMERFRNAEYPQMPRLADLKIKYPGDRFSRLKGSWCTNVSK